MSSRVLRRLRGRGGYTLIELIVVLSIFMFIVTALTKLFTSGAKAELREKVEAMRARLMSALDAQFSRELESSLVRIREAIGPYTRFVRSESERLGTLREDLARLRQGVAQLTREVDAL